MQKTMKLKGKIAIVTGASSGIGNGIARRFAQEGARLAVTEYHSPLDQLQSFVDSVGTEMISVKTDMRSTPEVNRFVAKVLDKYGRIDILASAAGSLSWARIEDISDEEWDNIVDGDMKGTFRAVRAVVPIMRRQKSGRMILMSSIEGKAIGWPGHVHYCAGKGGIDAMIRSIALEVARDGITVNGIAAGPIESRMIKSKSSLGPEGLRNLVPFIPVGFMGQPEDIAALATFLASDEARYITGQSIVVDGGYIIGPILDVPGANPAPPSGCVYRREDYAFDQA
jgi:3-oxoacyl-[acyl-carrier protein] reductase